MPVPPIAAEAHAAVDLFFTKRPTKEEIEASVAFHEADVLSLREEEGLTIAELVERISLAEEAQRVLTDVEGINPAATLPPLELNVAHLAYFLYADKQHLEGMIDEPPILETRLRCVEPFLRMIFQKVNHKPLNLPFPIRGQDYDDDIGGTSYLPRVKLEKGDKTIDSDQYQADQARRRDQCCIATDCPEIEGCHIMPFWLNNRSYSNTRYILRTVTGPMMPIADREILTNLLVPAGEELENLDITWNILCMNPLAHQIWDKAYFALEWIGLSDKGELDDETYKTIQLRWHWLPNCVADALGQHCLHESTGRKGDTGRILKFGDGSNLAMATAIHDHLAGASTISSHGVSLSRTSNFRPLVSGNILLIRVREQDLDKTRLMIQIQWLALRMAAISGAAEVVDDLDPKPPSHISELPTYPKECF